MCHTYWYEEFGETQLFWGVLDLATDLTFVNADKACTLVEVGYTNVCDVKEEVSWPALISGLLKGRKAEPEDKIFVGTVFGAWARVGWAATYGIAYVDASASKDANAASYIDLLA